MTSCVQVALHMIMSCAYNYYSSRCFQLLLVLSAVRGPHGTTSQRGMRDLNSSAWNTLSQWSVRNSSTGCFRKCTLNAWGPERGDAGSLLLDDSGEKKYERKNDEGKWERT